jgi:Tripartite tricarboxylate transporter TctB family
MQDSSARSDLWGGSAWLGFGLLILFESSRMDRFTKMGASLYMMPGFVPGILGFIIVLLGAALAWRGWRTTVRQTSSVSPHPPLKPLIEPSERLINLRISLALPLCLIYAAVLVGRVPFWLATFLFVSAFTFCFTPREVITRRRALAAIVSGGLTTAIVIGVFQYVFLVRLP